MPTPPAPPQRLELRLENSARSWLRTLPAIGSYALKERDQDTPVVPETEIPRPVIFVEARDEGRAVRGAPIRNIKLLISVRANSKAPGGSAESFGCIEGALETCLDTTNLIQALSSESIAVMLAVRPCGVSYRSSGLVRQGTFTLDCKCVASELTAG